jgi:hypothetical protein
MGLQLQISAVEESNSFILYDCTGIISKDNPGGWAAINVEKKQVTDSYFLITPPDLPVGSSPYKIDTYPDFPSRDDLGYEILPYMVGQSNNQMLSGYWGIQWVLTYADKKGISHTLKTSTYKILKKQVECCVDKWTKIVDKNAFKDKRQQKIIELDNLITSMNYAIDNELNNEAISIIEYLQEQCVCPEC